VAFVSDDLSIQREQFILVNKARPLPTRLINELLPVTSSVLLPRSLLEKKIPSELMKLLNRDRPESNVSGPGLPPFKRDLVDAYFERHFEVKCPYEL
jgi:hypothetical protein